MKVSPEVDVNRGCKMEMWIEGTKLEYKLKIHGNSGTQERSFSVRIMD